jgi:CRP/FNR family transcriptional regulator, anaerobic regulatory protein
MTDRESANAAGGDRVVDLGRLRRSCANCSLRSLCLPEGLPAGDIERLDSVVQQRLPIERGHELFHAGADFHNLYVVRSGSMRTTQAGAPGEEQVIGFHLPGELLGLDAISSGAHQCTAVALDRTSVCAVPFAELEEVAKRVPGLQQQLLRIISREMVEDHNHLAALGRRSARERLALFLHSLALRLERSGHAGDQFNLTMSRGDIASYLGLALETVSRLMTRLSEEGMIAIDRRNLRIVDREALAQAAGNPQNIALVPRHRETGSAS